MEKALSKRTFLGYLAAVPVGLAAARYIKGDSFISSASAAEPEKASGPFTLPDLPYQNPRWKKSSMRRR